MPTNAEFAQSASYIAKNAAAWAGDTAMLIASGIEGPKDLVKPEAIERFRKMILIQLDFATGATAKVET